MANERLLHELPLCPITNDLYKHEGHTNVHYVTLYSGSALRLHFIPSKGHRQPMEREQNITGVYKAF